MPGHVVPDGGRVALLAGLRVVDLADGYAELTARLLGELGSEVVRVAVPGGGIGATLGPLTQSGIGLYRAFRDAGKTVVELDPASAAGVAATDELLGGADIAIVADGWGANVAAMGADAIAARHPGLVVVAVSAFGQTGPCADWSSTELVAQAMSGMLYRSGVPELPPVAAPGRLAEDVGAVTAAFAALLAVHERRTTGVGQVLDVSTVLATAQCTDFSLALWSMLGMHQSRAGAAAYPLYECTDGLARIVLPMSEGEWRSMIPWFGSPPEWTGPAWTGMLAPDQRAEVVARLPERFRVCTRAEIAAQGDAVGLKITPVLTPAEALGNEHVEARETFVDVEVEPGVHGSMFAGFLSVDGRRAAVTRVADVASAPPDWPARVPAATSDAGRGGRPLAGLRVLEIGSGVAAPEAGRLFAEWGADVIKVESRRHPDFQRKVMGGDMNPAFASSNRMKRAFGVDLTSAEGRALVVQLIGEVDVVFENNATGVLDRLGIGWDVIAAANPRAVLVGTQLYGATGPWASRKGYGPSARAVGGLTWLWAHGPEDPRGVQAIHPDHVASRLCAFGALAGLRHRDLNGVGCRIDLAQFEAVSGLLGDLLLAESLEPGAAQPTGNAVDHAAPWGVYRCADDPTGEAWLAVCVADDHEWHALRLASDGALEDRPEWRTVAGRLDHRRDVDAAVAAWLRTTECSTMEGRLQAVGVAAGQALHARLQSTHPHFVARGYPVPVHQPGTGDLLLEGAAFSGTRFGAPACGPAPLPGQHTAAICADILLMSADEIAALSASGVIECAEP